MESAKEASWIVVDLFSRLQRMDEPDVAAYHTVVSHHGVPTKHSRSRVYHDMVTDVWMTFDSLYRISILVEFEAFRTKRYTLIYLDMVSYGAGFSYYDTGAVVNKEVIPIAAPG